MLVSESVDRSRKWVELPLLYQSLKSNFHRLRKLTDILNMDPTATCRKLEDISYGDAVYSVQREFMAIVRCFTEHSQRGQSACSLAGLIYVECCLRDVSPRSRIVCDLVDRLVDALSDMEREPRFQPEDEMPTHLLFWLLFIGAAAAEENTVVREKLMKWLAFLCRRLIHEPWTKTQETLKRISWVERGGRLFGAPLWEELTRNHS